MSARIVITGIGTVNCVANTAEETWQKVKRGESGIGCIDVVDVSDMAVKCGGQIKNFDPVQLFGLKEARRMDRYSQIAVASALQAWEMSGNVVTPENTFDIAVLMSAGFGGTATLEENYRALFERGPGKVHPLAFPTSINNMSSAQTAMQLGIHGLNFSISSACATSSNAIGEAAEIIKRGDASVAIAGGSEAGMVRSGLAGLEAMRALTRWDGDPTKASRPFDATRDGFAPSEGAAAVVLERLDHAQARGAHIIGELVGYGSTCDAVHLSAPDEAGTAQAYAVKRAIQKAGIAPEQIDYINAHGTSTRLNDATETKVIKRAFGDFAYKIPVSSTKSMTGHALSAAGALEAIFSMLAIRDSVMPPTINLEHPDPECDLDYIPNVARSKELQYVMSNSFGFGGHNSVLIFKKYVA
jgi:3-oxoacyl-[acyl-carrier-protein] synthase II